MRKIFRKKPIEIEAMQLTVDNGKDVCDWILSQSTMKRWTLPDGGVLIETLEGKMTANVGDWIIQGVQGEFYPCKPDIFAETYEEIP